jgi:hypothetical protein
MLALAQYRPHIQETPYHAAAQPSPQTDTKLFENER